MAKKQPRLEPVDSTSIAGIDYDEDRSELYVRFHDNDATYVYHLVPRAVYDELMASESIGAFVNTRIKPKYPVSKLD